MTPKDELPHSLSQSLDVFTGNFKGTTAQYNGLQDLGDVCTVKMRA